MKKLFLIYTILFALTLTLIQSAHAEEQTSSMSAGNSAAIFIPKTRASLSSTFVQMQGNKADDRHFYDFDTLEARMDFLSASYLFNSGWTLNALFQHYEFYTETIFPRAALSVWKKSNDRTIGAGDTYVTLVAPAKFVAGWLLIPDFGVSIPTGKIDYKSTLVGLESSNLAYNAQHGSGTYDALVGGTALYIHPLYTIGSRLSATLRTGTNSNDYTLGNMYKMDAWFEYNTLTSFTPRIAGYYKLKEGIRGYDKTRGYVFNGVQYENAADDFYHHDQKNWDVSASVKYSKPFSQNISLAAEVGVPVYQGTDNWDNSVVVSKYFGSLSVLGAW